MEPVWLELVSRELPVANLPPDLAGRRLVLLTDLHIGRQVEDAYLLSVFRRVAALAPDFVVHGGDLVTYDGPATLARAARLLADFPRGRLGTFAILGNHDYGPSWRDGAVADRISALLTGAGASVLRNQRQEIRGLSFIGLDDLWSGRFAPATALAGLPPGQPAVALCHNPDGCDVPGWPGFHGWILSGHTHGGQCRPPFLPPPLLPVRNRRYTAGAFALDAGRQLYISRGVGHLQRVRCNVRPEITAFTLRPA